MFLESRTSRFALQHTAFSDTLHGIRNPIEVPLRQWLYSTAVCRGPGFRASLRGSPPFWVDVRLQ